MKKNLHNILKTIRRWLPIVSIIIIVICCTQTSKFNFDQPHNIILNQVGYITEMPKVAFSKIISKNFYLIDNKNNKVFYNSVDSNGIWSFSGDTLYKLDFSAFTKDGTYRLVVSDSIASYPFDINNKPFDELAKSAIKSYYINRSGIEIKKEFAGKWARPAGHPDTMVIIHKSAADKVRPEGTIVSSPEGWYDAGDYNKYVVNSSISTYTLLQTLQDYNEYCINALLNIPESNNKLPDILDELLYNLRWVITMQDPNDGGVYHKLTTKYFESFVMPDKANAQRYMIQKTTSATLDYAALLSAAARILKPYNELESLIEVCNKNAEYAWKWALKHPDIKYSQPDDISTGTYGDSILYDEWFWASTELYLATGDEKYLSHLKDNFNRFDVQTWNNVGILGTISILDNYSENESLINELKIKEAYISVVDSLVNTEESSPFQISLGHFAWGSNSDVANHGMLKLKAYSYTDDAKYVKSAINDTDYLLGRNATGYCFVTGFGSNPPINIHHRPSASDSIPEPVPGFLVGGPNLIIPTDCGDDVDRGNYPAKAYSDLTCSYSTNEIAINWNAPLVYLMIGITSQE